MRFGAGLCILGSAAVLLSACSKPADGGGHGVKGTSITLAGNSESRPVFEKGLIPAFQTAYSKDHSGANVDFALSFDSSGAQTRAILGGLKADVAALSLSPEIDKLADVGLVSKDWSKEANHGFPSTSLVVIVVRQGNPKGIKDWFDLQRDDVDVILPNPDTSGAAQWNVAAIANGEKAEIDLRGARVVGSWKPMNDLDTIKFFNGIRARVQAFGKSGKEAQQIFSSGSGDVMVGWECEALDRKAAGDPIDIVYPSITLRMEPPVAVVTPKGAQPNPAAEEFVKFLSTPEAQRIYAQFHYRPTDPAVIKEVDSTFPKARLDDLLTIDKLGGWPAVQKQLFGPEGLWAKSAE